MFGDDLAKRWEKWFAGLVRFTKWQERRRCLWKRIRAINNAQGGEKRLRL